MTDIQNVSADLVWQITRSNNAYLVKRAAAGGVQFSRDPLNLMNLHSRKHAGYVNDKAIGVQNGNKGAVVVTKKTKHANRPAAHHDAVNHKSGKSNATIYKSVVSSTAKQNYRADLRREAVGRASALRKASGPAKAAPEVKKRG